MSQFRCNGSDGYLAWLDNVLGIRETANYDLEGIDFDFRVCASPSEVRDLIFEKNHLSLHDYVSGTYVRDLVLVIPEEEREYNENIIDVEAKEVNR